MIVKKMMIMILKMMMIMNKLRTLSALMNLSMALQTTNTKENKDQGQRVVTKGSVHKTERLSTLRKIHLILHLEKELILDLRKYRQET